MSYITLNNKKIIGDYKKPYIVTELNTSHFGDINIAKQMILSSKECGVDCVKFQSWSSDSLYSESYYIDNPIAKRIVNKFSINENQILELSQFAMEHEIDFNSTPYTIKEAKYLINKCNVPFIKVSSMELNNLPFLEAIGDLGHPIVLSTGMGTNDEIIKAIEILRSTGNKRIALLHCTALYPTKLENVRLQNIIGLRGDFPDIPIGFSDHTIGYEVSIGAVALGSCIIEKHFTLDNKKIGMDNQMATEPEDMKKLVTYCHNIAIANGGTSRVLIDEELKQRLNMRRSIVAKRDINIGKIIGKEDIECKRPGNGIPPSKLNDIIGKKIKKQISKGEIIRLDNLT